MRIKNWNGARRHKLHTGSWTFAALDSYQWMALIIVKALRLSTNRICFGHQSHNNLGRKMEEIRAQNNREEENNKKFLLCYRKEQQT